MHGGVGGSSFVASSNVAELEGRSRIQRLLTLCENLSVSQMLARQLTLSFCIQDVVQRRIPYRIGRCVYPSICTL